MRSIKPAPAPGTVRTWPKERVFPVRAVARKAGPNIKAGDEIEVSLIPFADAGGTGSPYKVWLSLPHNGPLSLLLDGKESRSRAGNQRGSINDEDSQSFVVTFDGKPATEDWFAVTLEQSASIRRVVFQHGGNFHDGGWFDASGGKPRVQVKREAGGAWETVGELSTYPVTSGQSAAEIKPGQEFGLTLSSPIEVRAVRVIGVPASGDNPAQAFSSCAELQAFGE